MIKCVIFDLGGVYFTNGTRIAIKKISEKYGLNEKDLDAVLKPGTEFGKLFRTGKISSAQFFNKLREKFTIKASDQDLIEIWFGSYKPVAEVISIIEKLNEKKINVYFLSDNTKERAEYLQERYDFLRHFKDGIFSHKAGLTKFDGTKIFELSLKQTGNKPEDTIFIDDNENHVNTARSLGMNVIHFKNPRQLAKDIDAIIKTYSGGL